MGFIRTAVAIAKQIGKTPVKDSLLKNEIFNLLHEVNKIPKKEFGRFEKLAFEKIPGTSRGNYDVPSKQINIDPYTLNKIKSFLHELEHARQWNPDTDEYQTMKNLIAESSILPYSKQPIERLARKVSNEAVLDPSKFSLLHKSNMLSSVTNKEANKGGNAIETLLDYSSNAKASNEEKLKVIEFIDNLKQIKKYSGKGWLYGGAGIGIARSGEED